MSSRAAGDTDQPILEELSSFYRDDMEFRTVTAMLNLLSRGEYDLENHWNPSEYSRFYLKTMASVGALMDRTGGEVAIMAKRTGKGMTLFVSSTALAKDQDAQDEPLDKFNGPLADLLPIPTVDVGEDIVAYILNSWNISFEAHIQTIAQLIYKCQQHEAKDPYLSIPWTNLGKYALAQSTTKFAERFQNQDITATLRKLREWCKFDSSAELCPDNRNPGLEQQDLHLIKIFVKGCSKDPGYPLLSCLLSWEVVQEDYLPEEDGPLLKELTSVILDALDLLGQTSEKLQQLRDLEVPPPRAQFEAVLEKAWYWSCVFDHVSWNSSFFEWFFTGYIQSLIYRYQAEISVDGPEGELLIAMIGAVNPVEYTTKVAPGIVDPYEIDEQKYLIWLRLISWPVKNALSFSYTRKVWSGVSLTCQVIQYSGTSSDMMPWQDVVLTLFPKDPAKCQQIIQALRDFSKAATHDELHAFRFNYWKFKNNVHSEAELACLYILSKIGMKPDGVSDQLYESIKGAYDYISPTSRLCPACTEIITELEVLPKSTKIQRVANHSMMLPCGFPTALPEDIRHDILDIFRKRLRKVLEALISPTRHRRNTM